MQTPCIDVCSIEPANGLCAGCGRTMEEISGWMSFSDEKRQILMAILPARLQAGQLMACGLSETAKTAEQTA
ncbi:hypothetical protein ASC97_04525 [Rhizobium sp. Root1203]|uniref:DUF1289 domain-containing protein n=1 Tax=Rhizobium sp. Root1203 TaxID=1736427 RepID=UPI00070BE964|nr:DUF1289 domain-containing protein [Rhizobium sp. Root1203]KQV27644.1 hypothetical protein ASC97_04525 [Rhizobium sp. Root1203]